jgi:opacity protein-like surface antigen
MTMKTLLLRCSLVTAAVCAASVASAADAGAPAATAHGAGEKGVFVSLKVGGVVPFSALGPNGIGGLDLGYALDNGLAFGVAGDYAQPKASGTESDARVAGGTYKWRLEEQLLQVMPFVLYRIKSLGAVVPYAGIGPRFYFQRSTVKSDGAPAFGETKEQRAAYGVGVPLGAELKLGPGAGIAEVLLQYGGLDHTITGKANSGAASLSIGYRMMF